MGKFHILPILLVALHLAHSQFFDPIMDDKTYLDNIQKEVTTELEEAQIELVDQAKVVENVTRAYIAAKLKENVFKVLRVMAENELTKASLFQAQRPKSPKQDTEDEDDDDKTEKPTTPLTGLGTAVKVNQQAISIVAHTVFSFLGEAFKIIFAGGKPKAKQLIADPAEILMNKETDVQILGVVSLLALDEQNLPIPQADVNSTLKVKSTTVKPVLHYKNKRPYSNKGKKGNKNDDESKEDDISEAALMAALSQDARIIDLFQLLGLRKASKLHLSTKNETLSGFDEENPKKPQRFNLEQFMRDFKKSLGELQSNVPDIYRGVSEAYKLLETVRGVATRLEEYVSDIF